VEITEYNGTNDDISSYYRKSPFLIGKPYLYGSSSIHQKSLIRKKQNRFSHVSHAGVVG
jgi:hypothetical protein